MMWLYGITLGVFFTALFIVEPASVHQARKERTTFEQDCRTKSGIPFEGRQYVCLNPEAVIDLR